MEEMKPPTRFVGETAMARNKLRTDEKGEGIMEKRLHQAQG
jgi:hypothetical protein